jgi:hypothetical protein
LSSLNIRRCNPRHISIPICALPGLILY